MICFFGDDFSVIGGVETTTYNLQKELEKKYGLKSDVFSLKKTMETSEVFTVLPFTFRIKYISIVAALFYLRRLGYTKIVTSYFAFNIINVLMSKILGYKSIIQEHASSKSYSRLKLLFIVLFYRFADEFIVLNSFDRDFYVRKYLKPRIIMNCYAYEKKIMSVSERRYHLVLSRLDENKRVHLAIEAWLLYKRNGGYYPLIVAGDGPCLEELKTRFDSKGVEFVGSVCNVHEYLSKARSLLITSRLECFPTVVVEGKYVGTPSIAFNVPSGLKDLLISDENGVLIPDSDCYLMAEAMHALDNDHRLSEMANSAFASASKFDSEKSVSDYFKLFNRQ